MGWSFNTEQIKINPQNKPQTKHNYPTHPTSPPAKSKIYLAGLGELYLKRSRSLNERLVDSNGDVVYKSRFGNSGRIYITNIKKIKNDNYILELDNGHFNIEYNGQIKKDVENGVAKNVKRNLKNNTKKKIFTPKESFQTGASYLLAGLGLMGLSHILFSMEEPAYTFGACLGSVNLGMYFISWGLLKFSGYNRTLSSSSELESLLD